jgi:hypothetical protein
MKGHIDVSSRHDFGGVYLVLLVLGLEGTIWEIIGIEFKNNLKVRVRFMDLLIYKVFNFHFFK